MTLVKYSTVHVKGTTSCSPTKGPLIPDMGDPFTFDVSTQGVYVFCKIIVLSSFSQLQ